MEIRPIEELQDSSSSPRREEVGRRTLGDYGGLLLSFFYRERFQLFTQHFPVSVEKLQKLPLASLQTPREQKNRTQLEKFYTFDVAIPPEDESTKKIGMHVEQQHGRSTLPRKSEKSVKRL